jgi:hypothetical protein
VSRGEEESGGERIAQAAVGGFLEELEHKSRDKQDHRNVNQRGDKVKVYSTWAS